MVALSFILNLELLLHGQKLGELFLYRCFYRHGQKLGELFLYRFYRHGQKLGELFLYRLFCFYRHGQILGELFLYRLFCFYRHGQKLGELFLYRFYRHGQKLGELFLYRLLNLYNTKLTSYFQIRLKRHICVVTKFVQIIWLIFTQFSFNSSCQSKQWNELGCKLKVHLLHNVFNLWHSQCKRNAKTRPPHGYMLWRQCWDVGVDSLMLLLIVMIETTTPSVMVLWPLVGQWTSCKTSGIYSLVQHCTELRSSITSLCITNIRCRKLILCQPWYHYGWYSNPNSQQKGQLLWFSWSLG